MDKLKLIIKREFIAKVRNKTFIVMTFLSPLLMVGMIALVAILTKSSLEKKHTIAYVDASNMFAINDFNNDDKTIEYKNISVTDLESAKRLAQEGEYYGLLYIPKENNIGELAKNIQFFSEDSPNMVVLESIERTLKDKLQVLKRKELGIDVKLLKKSKVNVAIKLLNYSGERTSKLINGLKMAFGIGAGYLLMMFIIIYGNMVMRSVIEEKTSRIIEVIISSVKPFQLMLGKVIGTASAGLLQFFIWSIVLSIIMVIASAIFGVEMSTNVPLQSTPEQMELVKNAMGSEIEILVTEIWKLPLGLMFFMFFFYFLGGYLLYSSIYAAIGAAVDNETDTQQFMMPVILPLMLGVYVGFSSVIGDPHGTIATVFSMIPLTSPIVMLMRIPFGVPWWQLVVSMSLLIITFVGVIWLAAKIYRVGILMYGKKPSYKELYKWLKY